EPEDHLRASSIPSKPQPKPKSAPRIRVRVRAIPTGVYFVPASRHLLARGPASHARRQGRDCVLSRHLAVPLFLAVASQDGPAHPLPPLAAWHGLVVAQSHRHDGDFLLRVFSGIWRRRRCILWSVLACRAVMLAVPHWSVSARLPVVLSR